MDQSQAQPAGALSCWGNLYTVHVWVVSMCHSFIDLFENPPVTMLLWLKLL